MSETPLYPAVKIGQAWEHGEDGLDAPMFGIGWEAIDWAEKNLLGPDGEPWQFTPEQLRILLHWYAIDETGRFLYRDGTVSRLKGWGKSPFSAAIACIEFVGPCRFSHWNENGFPVAKDNPTAWIQIAAVNQFQTRNITAVLPSMMSKRMVKEHAIDIGKEITYAYNGARRIESLTASPRSAEGARPSLVLADETHHWVASNGGHDLWAVIRRNIAKSPAGLARTLALTNAYEPSDDSIAQRTREAYEAMVGGESRTTGIFYDSVEAPPEAPLSAEAAPHVLEQVRGDSWWLDIPSLVAEILDPRNPPSQSRRFYYSQVVAAEDAWIIPQDFELCADTTKTVERREPVALFFDGSKSDDNTAIVGCRISDGHVFTLGLWQKPPGERGKTWTVPRHDVDARVEDIFASHNVVAFWGDPSHTLDDESGERYWDALFDQWHQRYCRQLELWAVTGRSGHAVMWDMTSPNRSAAFTEAAMRFVSDVEQSARMASNGQPFDRSLTHDGDSRLKIHARNARRCPNKWGVSLWKGHRESARKIDLAVCAVGARMVRREYLNANSKTRQRTGRVV